MNVSRKSTGVWLSCVNATLVLLCHGSTAVGQEPTNAAWLDGKEANASILLNKSQTLIPAALNPGFQDLDGGDLVIDTGVHDVKFCVGVNRTDQQGGISERIPRPLLKEINGVVFYEDNLLLSGVGFHGENKETLYNPYSHYAFGPIDRDGNDQSDNPDSPRYNLAYLPATVMFPKAYWNKRLIVYFHGGGDGPALYRTTVAPFQFPFDEVRLLKQGYAVATMATHVTAQQQNPNAVDGSFWEAFGTPDKSAFIAHNARLDATGQETRVSLAFDKDVVVSADATLARNVANLIKNLLGLRRGSYPAYTYAVGYSWGGKTIAALNGGRDNANIQPDQHPELLVNGRTPFTGGNFDIDDWTGIDKGNRARSLINQYGLVFDGFLAESGYMAYPGWWNSAQDSDYPVTTKAIYVQGDYEGPPAALGSLLETYYTALALPNAHPSLSGDMNDWKRIYRLEMGGHARYDFFFDMGQNGAENLFFDRKRLFNSDCSYNWFTGGEDAINQTGAGRRFRWFAEKLYQYDRDDFIAQYVRLAEIPGLGALGAPEYIVSQPRTYPIRAQLLTNLVLWVERGYTPPASHLDAFIMSDAHQLPGEEIQPGVWDGIPQCPAGCPFADESSCAREDCWITLLPGYGFPLSIPEAYRTAIQYLRDNAILDYYAETVASPDLSARLGSHIALIPDFSWMKPYDTEYLDQLYENHWGYARQVQKAYITLLRKRLIDPVLGYDLVIEAFASDVLR
ncbi:MAG: hypothetical protein QNJ97_17075 [Myxococcota bacterium]|nr:hypothetical protein [Myxococcota bacterium]